MELRGEIRMKKHPRVKVVGRRLRWTGHIQRMSVERLTKRARKTEEGGRRRRGRPTLRWEERYDKGRPVNERERWSKSL